jgi:hypothetical protein
MAAATTPKQLCTAGALTDRFSGCRWLIGERRKTKRPSLFRVTGRFSQTALPQVLLDYRLLLSSPLRNGSNGLRFVLVAS